MTNIPQKIKISDGINFNIIKDNRFKTARISISIIVPLSKNSASKNALLPFVLARSCEKYPDFTKLNEKLSELYGASLTADVEKLGEAQILTISATFLDDRYAFENQSISKELTELLCNIIFKPKVIENKFSESDVNQEKRQLIETLDAEYNDKRTYAKNRCYEIMCEDEKFSINPLGDKNIIKNLTSENIYDAWQEILKHARFEIMVLGNIDHSIILNYMTEQFSEIKRSDIFDISTQIIEKSNQIKEQSDFDNISQCKLVMGFRVGSKNLDDNINSIRLMNALLGATPHSKLFTNVREKQSLCYYCMSKFDKNKGILTIESGVEHKNIKKAKKEILKQIEEIKKGNFNQKDIDNTILSLCNGFNTVSDHLGGLESFYLSQIFCKEIKTPEQSANETKKLTKDDIINAAENITLDTIYTLINKE